MVQQIIGRAGHRVSRAVAASHQKQEGFINKLLNRRDLVALVGIRLKQKVEHRVPAVFGLSGTFLASRRDLLDPLCALLTVRQFGFVLSLL